MKYILLICIILFSDDYFYIKMKDHFLNFMLGVFGLLFALYFFIPDAVINVLCAMVIILYFRNLTYLRKLKRNEQYKTAIYHQLVTVAVLVLIRGMIYTV